MNTSQKMKWEATKMAAKNHKQAKNGTHCGYFCSLLVGLFLTGFYAFMAFANPDEAVTKQNADSKGKGPKYGCYAIDWDTTPVGPDLEKVWVEPNPVDGQAAREMVAVDVGARFKLFFMIMFVISLVSLLAVICGCCGLKKKSCGKGGACLHSLTNFAFFIVLVIGSVWRWSNTGAACSADDVTPFVCVDGKGCKKDWHDEYLTPNNVEW